MSAALLTSNPLSLPASSSAISLQGLAVGHSHCAKQIGQIQNQSGRLRAPVNLSARQAQSLGLMMSGTCGLHLRGSLNSADLQWLLVSRLQVKLLGYGSTLYKLTWKPWATPLGPFRSRLQASVLPISATVFTGWVTPQAADANGSGRNQNTASLCKQVRTLIAPGATLSGLSVPMGEPGRLNPAHSRWHMGLPLEWDACAPTETASTLKRQKSLLNV